jgi:N-acetylmuramoyl-L-alanine amidase
VRVVEAEVTGDNPFGVGYEEAFKSKLAVAQVILNRVESPHFPDTVHDVIFQKNAFTPLLDGRYYEVEISEITIAACLAALLTSTEDLTYGCEFFSSGTKECKYGYYVFTDEVGHSFFKSYRSIK